MKFKEYKIDYCQNRHLLHAIVKHAEDLGYSSEAWGETEIFQPQVRGHCVVLGKNGELNSMRTEAARVWPHHFFRLTKEDVIEKPEPIRLTSEEIRLKLGIDGDAEVTIDGVRI